MVLVDSSVWIEYFKGSKNALPLNDLIDTNNICVNDLILAELIPSINYRQENNLKKLLHAITKIHINIDWKKIINIQTKNLQNGINRVGISDLIIAENVIEHELEIFTLDKRFQLMSKLQGIKLYKS